MSDEESMKNNVINSILPYFVLLLYIIYITTYETICQLDAQVWQIVIW